MNRTAIIIAVGVGFALVGGTAVAATSTRARTIRLNNPGALQKNAANKWVGKVATSDKTFEAFDVPINGARAMLITMRTHYQRGENTIAKLVAGWTPDNRVAYANSVSSKTGMGVDTTFRWQSSHAVPIAKAMADWESGIPWWTSQLFFDAWGRM